VLEAALIERFGRRHAFAVSSGFHGLQLALRALDLPPTSRVAIPTLTCQSVLAAIEGTGHVGVIVDIEASTLTLEAARIPRDVAAVVVPHAYGLAADVEAVERLGKPWIEDCATSPTSLRAGTRGTLAVLSFASTKYFTAGAGGAVLCDNAQLAARIACLLDMTDGEVGVWSNGSPPYLPGRLADLNAAVAAVQLARLDEFHAQRQQLAAVYDEMLRGGPWRLPELSPHHGFYRYIVHPQAAAEPLGAALRMDGIDARTSVNPWLHIKRPDLAGSCATADAVSNHLLSLPIHPSLHAGDARTVADALWRACRQEVS